jgi:MFS family permease
MGRAADSHNRKLIIALGCLIWSLATAGMGSSSAFWSLLTFRLLLGLGAAFSNPASYSMIADLFPPDQRPTANGMMTSKIHPN